MAPHKRCPKCTGQMMYKRLTIHELGRKFLVTILECKHCKFWYQAMELEIDKFEIFKDDILDYRLSMNLIDETSTAEKNQGESILAGPKKGKNLFENFLEQGCGELSEGVAPAHPYNACAWNE